MECGAEVNLVNRKRILHAKCYGIKTDKYQKLIVSSGNFTGPGMSQNIESSIMIDDKEIEKISFSWDDLISGFLSQNWSIYKPRLNNTSTPGWKLLYDETVGVVKLDESEEQTMIVILGHADTARIQASSGENAGKGSQYFWLSKDCFDFFPPLTIRNKRGWKGTLSTKINLRYIDINIEREERVTFEAENNLDFRLGTGLLRYTRIANRNDLAAISRISEDNYELRIFRQDSDEYRELLSYAINFIGHQGKKFGYIENSEFENIIGIRLNKKIGLNS